MSKGNESTAKLVVVSWLAVWAPKASQQVTKMVLSPESGADKEEYMVELPSDTRGPKKYSDSPCWRW